MEWMKNFYRTYSWKMRQQTYSCLHLSSLSLRSVSADEAETLFHFGFYFDAIVWSQFKVAIRLWVVHWDNYRHGCLSHVPPKDRDRHKKHTAALNYSLPSPSPRKPRRKHRLLRSTPDEQNNLVGPRIWYLYHLRSLSSSKFYPSSAQLH